jgi:predicted transposase/invertase (TIGR01784 family)
MIIKVKTAKEIQKVLNLNSLNPLSREFTKDIMQTCGCDILFHAKCHNRQDGYIYLMIEGQSTNDKQMALRLLEYMIQIISRHQKKYGKNDKLPMVYPMIFWQNDCAYTAQRSVWDLFNYPELAKQAWTQEYKVINVQEISDNMLTQNHWTGLFQIVTKYIHKPNLLQKLDEFGALFKNLNLEESGNKFISNILCYVLTAVKKSDKMKLEEILDKNTNDGNNIMGSLAQDFIQQGISQGINIGKAEGIAEGETKERYQIAHKLLLKNLPIEQVAEITNLSISQLRAITKQI